MSAAILPLATRRNTGSKVVLLRSSTDAFWNSRVNFYAVLGTCLVQIGFPTDGGALPIVRKISLAGYVLVAVASMMRDTCQKAERALSALSRNTSLQVTKTLPAAPKYLLLYGSGLTLLLRK